MKAPIIALSSFILAASAQAATPHNYVELGLGASQLFSFNKDTNDSLSEFSVSPSVKLLTGSRLNRSRTLWFELGYSHNGEMEYEDTQFNSQTLFTGFKLTSDPMTNTSAFIKAGAGKTWTAVKTLGEQEEKSSSNTYYGGLGLNFRLDYEQSIIIEVQHLNDANSDEAINGVFLSLNQMI